MPWVPTFISFTSLMRLSGLSTLISRSTWSSSAPFSGGKRGVLAGRGHGHVLDQLGQGLVGNEIADASPEAALLVQGHKGSPFYLRAGQLVLGGAIALAAPPGGRCAPWPASTGPSAPWGSVHARSWSGSPILHRRGGTQARAPEQVVADYQPVVKAQRPGQILQLEGLGLGRVVASLGLSLGPAHEHHREVVLARVAFGVGVGPPTPPPAPL